MTEPRLTEAEREQIETAFGEEGACVHDWSGMFTAVEVILAARLTPVEAEVDHFKQRLLVRYRELDEARANRDRLAHENAALRQQVAELEAERDHFKARLAVRYAEMDETRDRLEALANKNFARAEKAESEQAYTYGLARKAHERAEAAERALAARDEVIARVQTSLDLLAEMHAKNADIRFGADVVIERVRADLAVPARQPDACDCESMGGRFGSHRPECSATPPTTDAEEAHVTEIEDGFGSSWTTCGKGCDLQVVRPGKAQCNRTATACPDLPVSGAAGEEER